MSRVIGMACLLLLLLLLSGDRRSPALTLRDDQAASRDHGRAGRAPRPPLPEDTGSPRGGSRN